jgi:hypothetical protein
MAFNIVHVKWLDVTSQVADGEDGLQLWRVAADILNK